MVITEMTDRDAAQFLGVTYATIRNGVKRGALTRVQKAGIMQRVAKEQVELFKGRRILLGELTPGELKKWQAINDTLTAQAPAPAPATFVEPLPFTAGEIEKANALVAAFARMYDNLVRDPNQVLPIQEMAQKKRAFLSSDVRGDTEELTREILEALRSGKINADRMTELTEDIQENGRDFEKMLELIEIITPIFEIYVNWLGPQVEQSKVG